MARLAGALAAEGVVKGDRVLIYMPMVPEAVMAMLACARIGAIHSVVFGGFAAPELATRIDDATAEADPEPPRAGSSPAASSPTSRCSTGRSSWRAGSPRPASCCSGRARGLARSRPGPRLARGGGSAEPATCVPVEATDPLYILYTSGTTGEPKGIVRDNGGHAVALAWSMANVYGVKPGEVYFAASDVGWVVGHSYIVYAPLLHGCTSLLYEGKPVGTPDAGAYWRVIAEHGVDVMFTAPTAFRAIKREDPEGALHPQIRSVPKFRTLFLAGERADPPTVEWAQAQLKVPVIDHWWQTETGWSITANCVGLEPLPVKLGSSTKPVPGYDLRVLDPEGNEMKRGEIGALCVKLPLPPGSSPTLWNADDALRQLLPRRISRLLPHRRCRLYRRGRLCLRDDAHRRHHQCRRPPPVDGRDRGGAGRRTPTWRNAPSSASPMQLKGQVPLGFLVLKAGANAAARARSPPRPWRWCASASARWRASRPRWWCSACPRRARARSCAAPCATSPTARSIACRRRSRTRRCSARSADALKGAGSGSRRG